MKPSPTQLDPKLHVMIDGFQMVGVAGSVTTYTRELVAGLVASGCTVTIALPREERNSMGTDLARDHPEISWVLADGKHHPDESYFDLLIWNHRLIPNLAERIQPDIFVSVYHHTPGRMPSGVKRATIIHDCCGLRTDCGYRLMGRAMLRHWSHLKSAAVFSDLIIPISEYTRGSFLKHFPAAAAKVTEPIYNAVSSAPVDADASAALLRKHQLLHNGYLLALAMPGKRKGIDILLKGYALYLREGGDLPLVFYGNGEIEPERWGLDATLKNSIHLMGRISDESRDSLFSGATAFLFPSRCEGFGYPIVEAARRGCPVIAWKNTTAVEILPEEEWMEHLEPEQLAKQIHLKQKQTPEERAAASARLIRQSSRFDGTETAIRFMGAFRSVINVNPPVHGYAQSSPPSKE